MRIRGSEGQEGEDSCAAIWFVEGKDSPSPSFIESFISSPLGKGGLTHTHTIRLPRDKVGIGAVLKTPTQTHMIHQ